MEDEEREIILYDQYNPDFNTVFDAAPNVPPISAQGTFESPPISKAVYLALPIVAIAMHVYFLLNGPVLAQ